MKIPDWLQATLAPFETSEQPFMEVAIFDAIRGAVDKHGNVPDEERPVVQAEWSLSGFHPRPNKDSVWGGYFAPMMTATTKDGKEFRSPDIANLNTESVTHWEERAQSVKDPVMRARHADAVWDLKKVITGEAPSHQFAQIAIDAYLEAANQRRFTMEIEAVDWLRRALDLSLSLRDMARSKRVVQAIFDFCDAVASPRLIGVWILPFDVLYGRKDLITPEQEAKIVADVETILAKASELGTPDFDPHSAQAAAERLAQHYRRIGDTANVRRVILRYGEAFAKLSKDASPMLAIAWLQPVIERYEQDGFKKEAEELQLLASEKAKSIESDMKAVSVPFEPKREEIDRFLEQITAGDLDTSLRRIATYFIPKVAESKDFLERMRTETPLLSFIPVTRFDDGGRPAGRIGSIDEDPEGRLHQQLGRLIEFQQPFLVWTLDRLCERYNPTIDDVVKFLKQSPVFSVSSDVLLHQGFEAYWAGDFVKAIHILVPRVERILRDLLAILGIPTVKTVRGHSGILDAKSMNDALQDERVRKALTEDLWRYLFVLYIDRRGGLNLRNDLAHGLASEEMFNRAIADRVVHSLLALSLIRAADRKKD
jgi:Domain of unknown function (DUF4209)